uniref:Putative secreted protein n=1 Tax=Ixodes ricinus TaxID=34613 RepID=A0A6B0TQR1_IXORI
MLLWLGLEDLSLVLASPLGALVALKVAIVQALGQLHLAQVQLGARGNHIDLVDAPQGAPVHPIGPRH